MSTRNSTLRFYVGQFFREASKQFERAGCFLQGNMLFKEQLNRTQRLMPIKQEQPRIHDYNTVFIAPNSQLIGRVDVQSGVSIFYGTVVRGDVDDVFIDQDTTIQDRCVISASSNVIGERSPVFIGKGVTIETGSVLHSCRVEDGAWIGTGSTIQPGAIVGKNSIVSPGSYVEKNELIGEGEMWTGTPARFERKLTTEEISEMANSVEFHRKVVEGHKQATEKSFEEIYREQERYTSRAKALNNVYITQDKL